MKTLINYLNSIGCEYEENVPLSAKTWLKTGGNVKIWIAPQTKDQLVKIARYCFENNYSYEVVGHTSNIYYVDSYNPNIVLSTINLRTYVDCEDYIECECGVPVTSLARYAVEKGYVGYCGLVNLPGTVGASICNNSSCFDCSISEHLIEAQFFNIESGELERLKKEDLDYSHRTSKIKKGIIKGIIVSVKLSKIQGVIEEEIQKADSASTIRKQTQEPPAFTLGSMYANLKELKCIENQIVRIGGGVF